MTSKRPERTTDNNRTAGDQDPLGRLDRDLDSFEAGRKKTPSAGGFGAAGGDGYRVLGQMLGGVLGGVGLGWFADHLAHTSPLGLVIGLFIGTGLSIYSAITTASRMGGVDKKPPKPVRPALVDKDDDEA